MNLNPVARTDTASARPPRWTTAAGICGIGAAIGFLTGRLARTSPDPVPTPMVAASKPMDVPVAADPDTIAAKQTIAAIRAAGTLAEIDQALPEMKTRTAAHEWRCLAMPADLLALARIGEWEHHGESLPAYPARQWPRLPSYLRDWFSSLTMAAWAERDPAAALAFATSREQKHGRYFSNSLFTGPMTRHHWELIKATAAERPELLLDTIGADFRMKDMSGDPAALMRLAAGYPDGAPRQKATEAALAIMAPHHPEAAKAVAESCEDHSERARRLAIVACAAAVSHPEFSAAVFAQLPPASWNTPASCGGHACGALRGTLSAILPVAPAVGLRMAATAHALEQGDSIPQMAAPYLPVRPASWLTEFAGAAAADPWKTDLLAGLMEDMPFDDPAEAAAAIRALPAPDLRLIAAEAIARRWVTINPEAARTWTATLPPAEHAGALAGMAAAGFSPPAVALSAFATAGLFPDETILIRLTRQDPESVAAWVTSHQPDALRSVAAVARTWAKRQPAAAASWALTITLSESKLAALTATVHTWAKSETDDAASWLRQAPLADADRQTITRRAGL